MSANAVKRLFTPLEANRTLPYVRRIVRDVLARGRELRALAADDRDGRERTGEALDGLMRELDHVGCSYKDWSFEVGLIDFPAIIEGRPVLLCWRSDEDSVAWYHPLETGYAGRRRIPAELLDPSSAS